VIEHMKKLLLTTAFGLTLIGCGAGADGGTEDGTLEPAAPAKTAPELTKEELAANERYEASRIAQLVVGQSTVSMYEIAPGEFNITERFPMGAEPVDMPSDVTLVELHEALAPGQPVPERVYEAVRRAEQAGLSPEVLPSDVSTEEISGGEFSGGRLPEELPLPATDGIGTRQQALPSTITTAEFQRLYCTGYAGEFTFKFCRFFDITGAKAWSKSHYGTAVICADTGAAQMRTKVSGAVLSTHSFLYGQCFINRVHGPHDFLGQALQRTIEFSVHFAEQTVHFAGYYRSGHNFVSTPPGY
jgi:hypothetical protein